MLQIRICPIPFLPLWNTEKYPQTEEISDGTEQDCVIGFADKQKYWFTKWKDINLGRELNAKISLEVYS